MGWLEDVLVSFWDAFLAGAMLFFLVCNIRHNDLCLKQKPMSVSSVIAHGQPVVGFFEPKEKPLKTLPTLTGPS